MKPLSKKARSIQPSQTLLLFARAKKMKAEGIDVVSFTAGEPDFPTPQIVKDAGVRAINENFTKYTQNRGIPDLVNAIAAKFKKDNNLSFEPSQILVSNGAKHSVYNALQAVCNPRDEVIIPSPFWVSYPEMVRLADAVPVPVKASFQNQFKITPAQLKRAITAKTKALLLNTPSNPTGAVYSREELEGIADVVKNSGIFIISDEIYEKVIYDDERHFSIGSLERIRDQVITVNGVSKAYSMTGWRIGFMGGHADVIGLAEKIQGQATSNANSIAQRAALAALANNLDSQIRVMVTEFDRRRRYLIQEFQGLGIDFVFPKGAFYLFFNVKQFFGASADGKKFRSSDDLCEFLLMVHKVALVPGTGFGDKNWVRMSYACSMEELQRGVERIKTGLSALKA